MYNVAGRKIIVIYDKRDGRIKGVKMTGDILHRRQLGEACGGISPEFLCFTREPRGIEVDVENDRCMRAINGEPFMLFGADGLAKFQKFAIVGMQERMRTADGIFIEPRPGIGDFILAAECASGAMAMYPGKRVVLGGLPKFEEFCRHVRPKIEWGGNYGDGSKHRGLVYIDQRVGYQFDPRGGLTATSQNMGFTWESKTCRVRLRWSGSLVKDRSMFEGWGLVRGCFGLPCWVFI